MGCIPWLHGAALALLDRGADTKTGDSEYGGTPLLWAVLPVQYEHKGVVRLLLDRGRISRHDTTVVTHRFRGQRRMGMMV